MDAISTRIKALTRIVKNLTISGAHWLEIGTNLQNEMYLFGDVNMDGKVSADDANEIMSILSGDVQETAMNFVLGNTDFENGLTYIDAGQIYEASSSTRTLHFVYATAFEYQDAAVGDVVRAEFNAADGTIPTYAYVAKAGVIGIYSNVKITTDMAGSIRILKMG